MQTTPSSVALASPQPTHSPNDLDFFGGKILQKPTFASLYLGDYWTSTKGESDRKALDNFGKFLPTSDYTSIWKQYGSGKGSFVGSTVVPQRTTARTTIKESTIKNVVTAAYKSGTLSKSKSDTVYTVFLPPGATLVAEDGTSSRDGLGGYHGSFDLPDGKRLYYAAIAYADQGNGINFTKNPVDNITIATSHEWSEAVTDPDVNNGTPGWYNQNLGEVSDIPINLGMPLKSVYQELGGFKVQKNWSNRDETVEAVAKK